MVTGDVQTGFWQTAGDMGARVQESSLYSPIKAHAEGMMRGTVRERVLQKGANGQGELFRIYSFPTHRLLFAGGIGLL